MTTKVLLDTDEYRASHGREPSRTAVTSWALDCTIEHRNGGAYCTERREYSHVKLGEAIRSAKLLYRSGRERLVTITVLP